MATPVRSSVGLLSVVIIKYAAMSPHDLAALDRRPAVARVFDAVCDRGPLARNDLRRLIRASPSTVSASVQELREQHLVDDSARGESTGGRQPTLLDLG